MAASFFIDFLDLEESGIPFAVFAKICNVKNIYEWRLSGVPRKHWFKLKSVLDNKKRAVANKASREAARAPQIDLLTVLESPDNGVRVDSKKAFENNTLEPFFLENPAPLVTIAKSQAIEQTEYSLKPFFSQLKPFKPVKVDDALRVDHIVKQRWALHTTARRLLPDMRVSKCFHAPHGLDGEKVDGYCNHHQKNDSFGVGINYHPEYGTASFFGLQTCGSIWSCPVCAAKISERRRVEIETAFTKYKEQGGVFTFVTRTVPHTAIDTLASIRDRFRAADTKFKGTRAYKELKLKYGVIGSIKVFEITVGVNGWHLHIHEIYFHESQAAVEAAAGSAWMDALRLELYPLWEKSATKAGFDSPSFAHGLQVQNGDFAAAYVAKWGREPSREVWGVDRELSKQHLKNSRAGLSPFDLLRQYQATGEQFYADLFVEYSQVMQGARQLIWSRGLKDYFEVVEKSDVELAEEEDAAAFVMGNFTRLEWFKICKHGLKADVLLLSVKDGFSAVQDFLKNFA